jgi:hypothetical protein
MGANNNPVLYNIEGIPIRKEQTVTIRFQEDEYVRLVKLHLSAGKELSLAKIILLLTKTCQNCGHDTVDISVQRNHLSAKRQATGGTVSSKKAKL